MCLCDTNFPAAELDELELVNLQNSIDFSHDESIYLLTMSESFAIWRQRKEFDI